MLKQQWENQAKAARAPVEPSLDAHDDISELSLPEFLAFIERQDTIIGLESQVQLGEAQGDRRQRADVVAEKSWSKLDYRFL